MTKTGFSFWILASILCTRTCLSIQSNYACLELSDEIEAVYCEASTNKCLLKTGNSLYFFQNAPDSSTTACKFVERNEVDIRKIMKGDDWIVPVITSKYLVICNASLCELFRYDFNTAELTQLDSGFARPTTLSMNDGFFYDEKAMRLFMADEINVSGEKADEQALMLAQSFRSGSKAEPKMLLNIPSHTDPIFTSSTILTNFEFGDFFYVVRSVQWNEVNHATSSFPAERRKDQKAVTIARVCKSEKDWTSDTNPFISYAEFELTCDASDTGLDVKSAELVMDGKTNELILLYSKNGASSKICWFTIDDINRKFNQMTSSCERSVFRLQKTHECEIDAHQGTCDASETYDYLIQNFDPLPGNVIVESSIPLNAIASLWHRNKYMMGYILTADGLINQILIDVDHKQIVKLLERDICDGVKCKNLHLFGSDGEKAVFAINGKKLYRFSWEVPGAYLYCSDCTKAAKAFSGKDWPKFQWCQMENSIEGNCDSRCDSTKALTVRNVCLPDLVGTPKLVTTSGGVSLEIVYDAGNEFSKLTEESYSVFVCGIPCEPARNGNHNTSSVATVPWGDGPKVAVIAAVIVALVLALIAACVVYFCYCRRKPTKPGLDLLTRYNGTNGVLLPGDSDYYERYRQPPALQNGHLVFPTSADYEGLKDLVPKEWLISVDKIYVENLIGEGNFGIVYKGTYRPNETSAMPVAIKTLQFGGRNMRQFLTEGLLMADFSHPRVLSLTGIGFGDHGYPLILTPFLSNGNMLMFLRNPENKPTLRKLLQFAQDIADGMQYLHKLKFIHRDLAARNCMLDDTLRAKIADFGLSRDVYESEQYLSARHGSEDLPLRWMPLESIEKGVYDLSSDVWSYGVVLWEITTRGEVPYGALTAWDLPGFLRSGRKLEQPTFCPNLLYELMVRCWNLQPGARPTFNELCNDVTNIVEQLSRRSANVDLESPYMKPNSQVTVV